MKVLNLALGLILFTSVSHAAEVCIQTEQPAVSPDGVCEIFSNPCEVPEDWKAIPSCALVSGEGREARISLEEKMKQRLNNLRERLKAKRASQSAEKDETKTNTRHLRMATGSYTRTKARGHRLSTKENVDTKDLRTSTRKNYASIGLRKQFAQKGGYSDDTKTKVNTTAYDRPAQVSSTTVKRTGNLKTTTKWSTLSKQHMRQRNYGKNPYSAKSKYAEKQKAKRDEQNKAVDVEARKRSGSRIWRGQKEESSIEQELIDQE